MAEHRLVARVAFTHNQFSGVFLAWYLAFGLIVLLFLFYFNRILAALLSSAIRIYTWHYYRVQVDIQSLQLSPLAGRIFFKRVRYYGQNETILIQDGYITWRYWLTKVEELGKEEEKEPHTDSARESSSQGRSATSDQDEEGGIERGNATQELPCRISVKVRGVQWFIYNRTPIYDDILSNMVGAASKSTEHPSRSDDASKIISGNSNHVSTFRQRKNETCSSKEESDVFKSTGSGQDDSSSTASTTESNDTFARRADLPVLLNILPVGVQCGKAAVVLGNSWTQSILVARVDGATGRFTAALSRPADFYRQVIDFNFEHPSVQFKYNKDYKSSLFTEGEQSCTAGAEGLSHRRSWYERLYSPLKGVRASNIINDMFPSRRGSINDQTRRASSSRRFRDDGQLHADQSRNKWIGLTRYLDDDDDTVEQERWRSVEYARVSNVVDCPSVSMSYYWDIPGKVKTSASSTSFDSLNVNRSLSPEWGIELKVRGGMINYGPWADRQRADIQQMFFPQSYKDAMAMSPLATGEQRVSTELKIFVVIEEDVILRIPHREETKDWKWKGRKATSAGGQAKVGRRSHLKPRKIAKSDHELESRPFGWMDTRLQKDSTVKFLMSMVADQNGFRNLIDMDLKGVEISSSVNHATFFRSRSTVLKCDLSNPLCWNSLRKWNIHVRDRGVELFILRDHLFLLTDLVSDWSSGPSPDFLTFVPFEYSLDLAFEDSKLYLNANESNIIDNPTSLADNTFVVLGCRKLAANVRIPAERYRPNQNRIEFKAGCEDVELQVTTPPWNTHATFLDEGTLAHLKALHLDGSYTYNLSTSPALTDILEMTIRGSSPKVQIYGFLLKYLMNIKENYFGDDIHFQTFNEYQSHLSRDGQHKNIALNPEHHKRPTNDLDTILSIQADNCCGVIPSHIYSAQKGVRGEVYSISADLRITNYYMDLSLSSSPILIFAWEGQAHVKELFEGHSDLQLSIDGLEATGHRLFGLPPDEPAYMCDWDFEVGGIRGECSKQFLQILTLSIRSFLLSFKDMENTLKNATESDIHDVTFLRVRLNPIALALRLENKAALVRVSGVRLDLNDWSGPLFSDRLHLSVPELSLAVVDTHNTSLNKEIRGTTTTHALFQMSVEMNKVSQKHDFDHHQRAQQSHVALHDLRTNRVPWLLHTSRDHLLPSHIVKSRLRPPAMIFPPVPHPVHTSNMGTHWAPRGNAPLDLPAFHKVDKAKSRTLGLADDGSTKAIGGSSLLYTSEMDGESTLFEQHTNRETTRSAFAFSSPFKAPHFPLLALVAERKDMPRPMKTAFDDDYDVDQNTLQDASNNTPGDESERTGIMISLPSGLAGFCTPDAMGALIQILEGVHGEDLTSMIDELQLDVVDELSHDGEQLNQKAASTNFRVFIPQLSLRFINVPDTMSPASDQEYERYDFHLMHASFCGRSVFQPAPHNRRNSVTRLTTHVSVQDLLISATESLANSSHQQAAVTLHLQNLLFWAVKESEITLNLQLANVDLSSVSRRVQFVSSLLDHTIRLVHDLQQRFATTITRQRKILQLFVLLLTQQNVIDTDPPFFSGASHVLRSAHGHLRVSGSWWMISKLRHVLQNLTMAEKDSLLHQCTQNWRSCPKDAANSVAVYFEQHHIPYASHVPPTQLLRRIFNIKSDYGDHVSDDILQIQVSFNLTNLRVVIDPGKSQNELNFEHCVASIFTGNDGDRGDSHQKHGTKHIASIHFAKVAARLDWSLIELMENIMEMAISTNAFGLHDPNNTGGKHLMPDTLFQISVQSDTSILSVAAINVKSVTVCKGLRTSFVIKQYGSTSRTSSFLVKLDGSQTDLLSETDVLSEFNLSDFRLAGSQEVKGRTKAASPWSFVTQARHTSFRLLETPLRLSVLMDNVIQQEVAQLVEWTRELPATQKSDKSSSRSPSTLPRLQFTWMLGSFDVSLMLLPSLLHQIWGEGIRLFMTSKPNRPASLHLELRPHHHGFHAIQGGEKSMISTISLPTIHLRVMMNMTPQVISVSSRIYVGRVRLSASALHAIFNALNQSAIISLIKNLQRDSSIMQDHLKEITANQVQDKSPKTRHSATVIVSGMALVDGIVVETLTPASSYLGKPAKLIIDLGHISMQGTNQEPESGTILKIPELHMNLNQIQIGLFRQESSTSRPCGDLSLAVVFKGTSSMNTHGKLAQTFELRSQGLEINLSTETAAALIAVAGHLRETLQKVELAHDVRDLKKLTRRRLQREGLLPETSDLASENEDIGGMRATYSLVLQDTRVTWKIGESIPTSPLREAEDLILSFKTIDLTSKQGTAARLLVQDFQLQMAPASQRSLLRSANSAWLPEVVFNVAYKFRHKDMRLAFQAVGKTFDLRLTSQSILPANDLRRSMTVAAEQVRSIVDQWQITKPSSDAPKPNLLGQRKLTSLLVYADFAGAVVHVQGQAPVGPKTAALNPAGGRQVPQGKYNQFTTEDASRTGATLKSPGVAVKVEYSDGKTGRRSLNAEMKVFASSNILFPTTVPLVLEISSSIKEIIRDSQPQSSEARRESKVTQPKLLTDDALRKGDPSSLLGKCNLNLGLRICKQDFSLSCQPIARVAARARFDDFYFTINTIDSDQHDKFFTMTANVSGLETSVQHVYSRESSGSISVDSVVLSCMNSRHVTAANGISALLKFSPVKAQINAKQLQDYLLFREIWIPPEIRNRHSTSEEASPPVEGQNIVIQRYQQLAGTSSFTWNASLAVASVDVQLDFGSSIGKSQINIGSFWMTSQKSSLLEQNLCIGCQKFEARSTGRMGALIEMGKLKVRTMIKWPAEDDGQRSTPLVQASASFDHLGVKVGFDFQSFLMAEVCNFDFIMYNVRSEKFGKHDRLVSVLEAQSLQAFCTSTSASQALSLVQAFQRLIEEKQKAYRTSLMDLEKFLRRTSTLRPDGVIRSASGQSIPRPQESTAPLRLQTDVVVSIKSIHVGAFPGTFTDTQVLKLDAFDTSARFAVYLEDQKIHSTLGMTLGQLRVALSSIDRTALPSLASEATTRAVVAAATNSRGGTILKVPRLVADMQTWQYFGSTHIDYIFNSEFQGRVDVGWNYSRISYIRGMHATHVRTLAQRLGKPLPQSAVQISGLEGDGANGTSLLGGQEKITAVVNVPQSKYSYSALRTPVIETPQLRDMGEATPPLEWIGLHRERLPTLTHQVVIVALLEVAKEVDDAYSRILGAS